MAKTKNKNKEISDSSIVQPEIAVSTPSFTMGVDQSQASSSGLQGVSLTGHGAPVYVRTRDPPKLDSKDDWVRYSDLLVMFILEVLGFNLSETQKLEPAQNMKLYEYLIRGLDKKSYEMIFSQFKHNGLGAFNYLNEMYLGTEDLRRSEAATNFGSYCLKSGDNIEEYISGLYHLFHECTKYGFMAPTTSINNSGETYNRTPAEILIVTQLQKMPQEYSHFVNRIKDRRFREGYPTLDEFTKMLADESRDLKTQTHSAKVNVVSEGKLKSTTHAPNKHLNAKGPRGRRRGGGAGRGHVKSINSDRSHHNGPQPYQHDNRNQAANSRRGRPQNRGRSRPINCKKCLSRDGSHTTRFCKSNKWCSECFTASHNEIDCKFLK